MKRFVLPEGMECRGFIVKIYPTEEQERVLEELERVLKYVWNYLVKQTEEVLTARKVLAVKRGLVPDPGGRRADGTPCVPQPNYDGMSPDHAKAVKEEFYDRICEFEQAVHEATSKLPECAYRTLKETKAHFSCSHDYQLMRIVSRWRPVAEKAEEDKEDKEDKAGIQPTAHMLQALVHNYFTKSARRKKFRRAQDRMPLQVRSGDCFELGNFGDRRGRPYYNCRIRFGGLKILGRLPGRMPWGRVIEGVSIRRSIDGWSAAIKQVVPVKELPAPVPGSVIGVDLGLDNVAAFSEPVEVHINNTSRHDAQSGTRGNKGQTVLRDLIRNPRDRKYAEKIAERQSEGLSTARLEQARARHMRHLIYNQVIKPLMRFETIKIERLSKRVGQIGGSTKKSTMGIVERMLREAFGARVVEVDARHTSQICSKCGHHDKEAWSYESGPICTCSKCGFRCHRDVNAARNIAQRPALASGAVVAGIQEPLADEKRNEDDYMPASDCQRERTRVEAGGTARNEVAISA